MVTLVCEEGGHAGGGLRGVVVSELGVWQQRRPVILLVVDIHAQVLFQDLVGALGLPVGLGVVRSTEVGLDTEEGAERRPEPRHEVLTAVRHDVGRCPVL